MKRYTHEQIRAMREAAAPRPWEMKTNRHPETGGGNWGWIEGPYMNWCWSDNKGKSRAQAAFVAAAPQIVAQLLTEIGELKQALYGMVSIATNLGDFRNGNVHEGIDEGQASAGEFIRGCAALLEEGSH